MTNLYTWTMDVVRPLMPAVSCIAFFHSVPRPHINLVRIIYTYFGGRPALYKRWIQQRMSGRWTSNHIILLLYLPLS